MPSAPSNLAARSLQGVFWLTLGGLFAVQLWTLWSLPYFPTQDGPVHLEIADLLNRFWSGEGGRFREYFALNTHLEPNWTVYFLLAGLLKFLPSAAVTKAIVTLCLSLWLLAALLYSWRSGEPSPLHLALFMPLAANFLFHMGFWNFSLGVPAALVFAASWLLAPPRNWRSLTLYLLASLALYFTHIVAFAAAWLVIGCILVAEVLAAAKGSRRTRCRQVIREEGVRAVLAAAPSVFLVLRFIQRQPALLIERRWEQRLESLRDLDSMASFARYELLYSRAFAVLLVALLVTAIVERVGARGRSGAASVRRSDGWLFAAAVFLVLYTALPSGLAGGGYLSQRLLLFVTLSLVAWLCLQRLPWPVGVAATLIAATLWGLFIAAHAAAYRRQSSVIEAFMEIAPSLEANSTMVTIVAPRRDLLVDRRLLSYRVHALEHVGAYLSVDRGVVDLTNYQAGQGYFPIVDRRSHEGAALIEPFNGRNLRRALDFTPLEATGGRVDYVVVLGVPGVGPALRRPGVRYQRLPLRTGNLRLEVFRRVEPVRQARRKRAGPHGPAPLNAAPVRR